MGTPNGEVGVQGEDGLRGPSFSSSQDISSRWGIAWGFVLTYLAGATCRSRRRYGA